MCVCVSLYAMYTYKTQWLWVSLFRNGMPKNDWFLTKTFSLWLRSTQFMDILFFYIIISKKTSSNIYKKAGHSEFRALPLTVLLYKEAKVAKVSPPRRGSSPATTASRKCGLRSGRLEASWIRDSLNLAAAC